jgi:pectin methylesterase-like acyl-CoA thioesterase
MTSMLLSLSKVQQARTDLETIIVPDDYPTIQAAINAANDGDTIFVKIGTYYEHVVVNKSLSLI